MRRSGLIDRISIRRRVAEEGGFTVIEASIAMLVAAMMFTALSSGLMSGLKAVRDARLFQQATSVGEEAVEAARNLQYETLSMQTSDLSGDPRIQAGLTFDPDGSGALLAEPVVATASGATIVPHITTQTLGNTTYTTSRYVTWVDDALQGGPGQSYKRMVVIVEWPAGGTTNTYRTSSFIARARRGLPVPKFELAPEAQTLEVEQGNLVVFAHTIRNLGIVDTYDLVMPDPDDRSWIINFYKDTNQNGTFEPAIDSLLLDTNSTGTPDTGSVATDEIVYFLAVFLLGLTEAPGTEVMTLTATSGANNAVSHSAQNTLEIGVVGLTLNLHNNPTPPVGNTTAQANMAMDISPGSSPTLYQYSTNHYSGGSAKPGRFVDKRGNPAHDESNTKFMANWVHQVPQNTLFNGTAQIKVWVAAKDFKCDKTLHIRAFLRKKDTSATTAGTLLGSVNAIILPPGGSEPCEFRQQTLSIALTNVTVETNKWVELKITNVEITNGDAALIAYDTLTYNSTLKLPQVST